MLWQALSPSGTWLRSSSPGARLVHQLGCRNYLVHKPHLPALLGCVLLAEVPELARPLFAADARQVHRVEAGIDTADLRTHLAKLRRAGSDREIADNV